MAWRVDATPEELAKLRGDEGFAELLTLGRVANLLRAALMPALDQAAEETTSAERTRSATTLLLSGLLAEAFPVLERSGKHFRNLPAFKESILPIIQDPVVQKLREKWLTPIRNQAVCHNDAAVSRVGLEKLQIEDAQPIAKGSSDDWRDVFYPLSEIVGLVYVAEIGGAASNQLGFLDASVEGLLDLALRVGNAVDALMGEALADLGFTVMDHPAAG